MTKKQTKQFEINGYFKPETADRRIGRSQRRADYTQFTKKDPLAFKAFFKVNSAKQAQERFLKKYELLFEGEWRFEILDMDQNLLLQFIRDSNGHISTQNIDDNLFDDFF